MSVNRERLEFGERGRQRDKGTLGEEEQWRRRGKGNRRGRRRKGLKGDLIGSVRGRWGRGGAGLGGGALGCIRCGEEGTEVNPRLMM